ncbi:MAG: selenocysteine-specific translation elongation factor [Deltaproteobacteria bacterium]|nr:selenocysteine-specific translation elongation factor [Deltaproteobacteria bacterium]
MNTISPLIIGTAGHIDHGKTSLIKALTGIDTDRLKEEKERGISIDLGFAYLDLLDGAKAGIVDVPGHERFIRNMLAGATGFDLVLFVVAADDGIMPQTREHLDIIHLLGISKGVFVITKIDLAGEKQINKITADIRELVKNTSLKDSPILQVSSVTGFGIDKLKNIINDEAQRIVLKPEGGFFRLPVDRSFSIKGFGTVVTGTVASGGVKKNDKVVIISKKDEIFKEVKIRGIQSHFNEATTVTVGQRAAVNLSGIPYTDVRRGDVLAAADLNMAGNFVDVCFEFLPVGTDLKHALKPIKNCSTFKLHHMTDETIAQVFFSGIKEAAQGVKVYGQIKLKAPMVMMRGDRFILRDSSVNATIGGGKVLLPYSKKRRSIDAELYKILDSHDLSKILISILSDRNTLGIDRHKARLMLNLSGNKCEELIASCNGKGEEIVQIVEELILKDKINNIAQHTVNTINKYHADNPADVGIDETSLLQIQSKSVDRNIFQSILNDLIKSGRIAKKGNVLYLPSHKAEAKGIEKEIEDALISMFSDKGYEPIKPEEILQRHSYKKEDIKKVFQLLIKRGIVIKIAEDGYISKDKLDECKDRLVGWIADKGKIKAAEFRDLLGCGRKFAIELLEYFDKEKITLRSGDYRVLRKKV